MEISLEDLMENAFRVRILSTWSRERQERFCLHILGDEAQEMWSKNKELQQENIRLKQYVLELDRKLQTGESHAEIQSERIS